jgi:putative tricarboxylic transport membrane protein
LIDALRVFISSPTLLLWLSIAVPIGLFFGIVPGFGGKLAIISVMPLLFRMDPASGIVFLISLHAVVHTGGALPAILFGIPGTGPSTAMLADGHAMARRGEAVRALTASTAASVIGGVLGAVVLAALIPFAMTAVKWMSYPEIFFLALFGILFCALLSEGALAKGLLTGCFGLLLATVGAERIFGTYRFTGDHQFLWGGIDLITAILAIYAVPEMIEMATARKDHAAEAKVQQRTDVLRQQWLGLHDVLEHRWLTFRTSMIGALIGIIPGLGGDVASWFCYGHAAQNSKTPEKFGHGAVEGIIGPEAANNSKEGGALVPTLFLGIPGSSGMAVLMVALVPLGISPGPRLAVDQPQLVWIMVWALAASNILAGLMLYLISFRLNAIARIRAEYLVPYVYLFVLISIYLSSGEWRFYLVMAGLALVGYAFKKFDWPRAPFVIGFILGPAAEDALVKSLGIWGGTFFVRPASLVIIAILTLGFVRLSRRMIRQAAQNAARLGENR